MTTVTMSKTPLSPDSRKSSRFAQATALIAGLAVLAMVVVVWVSPLLGANTIDVRGADGAVIETDLSAQVIDAAQVATGTPLARINLAEVANRIEDVGPVLGAVVEREWPSTLVVTLTVRTPVATTMANGQWWLLDAAGKPYQAVSEQPDDLVPLALVSPSEGDRATMAALEVAASLAPQVRKQLTSITARTEYDVSLDLPKSRTVIWGSTDNADAKNALVSVLLKQPGKIFNVTDPTLVTVSDDIEGGAPE